MVRNFVIQSAGPYSPTRNSHLTNRTSYAAEFPLRAYHDSTSSCSFTNSLYFTSLQT